MGKTSEIAWMQHLNYQAPKQSNDVTSGTTSWFQLPVDDSIASMNYHLDYQSISQSDVTGVFVLPPKALADQLFQIYLEKVHISLPFIRHDLFLAQYNTCYSTGTEIPGKKWLAVFNMIFAIGCAFSRLSEMKILREIDENIFASRARSLSFSENVIYDPGDLQQVQAEALMAFFFLIQSQVNRYDSCRALEWTLLIKVFYNSGRGK